MTVPGQSLDVGLVAERAHSLGINGAWQAELYGQPVHEEQELQAALLWGQVHGLWNQRPGVTHVPTRPGCEGTGLSLPSWETGTARPTSRACACPGQHFLPVICHVGSNSFY